ncbi:MAG: hypothetical protein HKN73_16820 [Gemmatimonadetes bacterium]|nr:hypothetical protein [Gemmatimonadota bacterium]
MLPNLRRPLRAVLSASETRRPAVTWRWLTAFAFCVLLVQSASSLDAQVPTPASVLGHAVGADFEMASWDEMLGFFRALDEASEYMELLQVGHTSYGRPWYAAVISTPENLSTLEDIRDVSLRLAHPEGLDDEAARTLAAGGKAVVHIDGGMHSTEIANAQHTMQLAYDLLSTVDEPWTRDVLENVVLMLWPSLNPDGVQLVSEWYGDNVGTPFEVAPMPWLYQKYIGHDNNRDAYMLNAVETRVIVRTWREWEPQIIHTHHQSSPFPTRIWLPPFAEPVSSRAPALVSRTINSLGMAMAQALEEHGQVGATHMDFFDAWYPGYSDYMPIFQNIAAYWTETALYRYATPRFYTVADFPDYRAGLRPEALYASPWQGGWWRVGDAVAYMVTASKAVLDYAAKYRAQILFNRYRSGADQASYFRENPPYAYLVPRDQGDPVAAVELLRRLAFLGIPIHSLDRALTFGDRTYPEGTWVIRTDHEFGETARVLLEVQEYPDLREFPDGPPSQPYDVAGWTLSALMDVAVVEVREPLSNEARAAMSPLSANVPSWQDLSGVQDVAGGVSAIDARGDNAPVDASPFDTPRDMGFDTHPVAAGVVPPPGRLQGSGSRLALDPDQNNAFRAVNRAWRTGGSVAFRPATEGAPARYLVDVSGRDRLVSDLALQAEATSESGDPVMRPRVGLYRPWAASMDEGWTRWVLERFEFEFQSVRDTDFQAGRLGDRYDVLILPSERPASLRDGHDRGTVPDRYAGGMGAAGLRALDEFVRQGGRLIALNASSDLVIDALGLPVENVLADAHRTEFFSTGSLMEVGVDTAHPLMAGERDNAVVFFDRSPAFELTDEEVGVVLASYPEAGSPLVSGYLLGEERLHGRAAAVVVPHGEGAVILFGFRPQWRGQTFGTFGMLFNALVAPLPAEPGSR